MKLFACVNFLVTNFVTKMFLIGGGFSIFVVCTLLPTMEPRAYYSKLGEISNPVIGGLQGHPDDNHQKRQIKHNRTGETANLNTQNEVLNADSQETVPLEGEAIKVGDSNSTQSPLLCQMCICKRPFHEDCLKFCCDDFNAKDSNINSQQPVTNPTTSTVNLALEEHVNQDYNKDISHNINSKIDLKESNEHQENADFSSEIHPVTVYPDFEKSLPSNPANFDPDASSQTTPGPVSNGASNLFNAWTLIFILASTSLFIVFRYAKQWTRNKLRERYINFGLNSEARPCCLNDVLEHDD